MSKFNIKNLAIANTADMPVRDASGEPQVDGAGNAVTITLYSPGSKEYQKAKHAAEERNSTRVFSRMQGRPENKPSAQDKVTERAEFLAACTVSFNNFDNGGTGGYELFKRIYSDIEIGHVADDAERFISDRGNFKKASVPSLSPTFDTPLG